MMNLRRVPTKVHGVVDLTTGPALIAAPTLLRMNGNTGATIPPRVVGSAATLYSLLTDYEFGLKRVLPMRTHLALDAVAGLALAATPHITGASKQGARHWLPHALFGANELVLALTTKSHPPRARRLRSWLPKGVLGAVGAGSLAGGLLFARSRRVGD